MTDRRDDDFRVRPSAPKNRGKGQGQSFVSKVLKQAGKASSGKSAVRRPRAADTGQRPGSRLGRGHTAARFAGAKLTSMSRRVTIKTLLVNQQRASPQSLAKHLRYIERDGAGRDGEPGQAYGPQTDAADLDAFKERCADDRHHFRFIVSPEDGAELDDLRTYTRHLVDRMEADLGTRLDWVAVDHWNTDNPHTHLIVRGRDDTGKDLIIAGDYIADGFRHRAAELATEWLGPRTELEIQQTLQREVEQERWTSLDRTLKRELGAYPLKIHKPEGAIFLWLWFENLPVSSQTLYEMLKAEGTLIIPGEHFFVGIDTQDYPHACECIRMSIAQDAETLEKGIAAIGRVVRGLYDAA